MIVKLRQYLKRSRFLVAIVRDIKFGMSRLRLLIWLIVRSHAIRSYFSSNEVHKLQIGTGPNILEGWLNTDSDPESLEIVYLDARRKLPFEDNSFNYIFSEHQIEHLTYAEGLFMIRECYRVLKPGGRFRLVTPDFYVLMGLNTREKDDLQQQYIQWITDKYLPEVDEYREEFVINCLFHGWGHQFIYDQGILKKNLEDAGFTNVTRYPAGESDMPDFQGIESHGKVTGGEEMNRFISMVLESIRPA